MVMVNEKKKVKKKIIYIVKNGSGGKSANPLYIKEMFVKATNFTVPSFCFLNSILFYF